MKKSNKDNTETSPQVHSKDQSESNTSNVAPEIHRGGAFVLAGPLVNFRADFEGRKSSIEVITWRQSSSMVSVWREYLCLAVGGAKRFKLFTGRYEALDEASNYYDEEAEDYVLPSKIHGKTVRGIEDEYVVGGELSYYGDDDHADFDSLDETELLDWLRRQGWVEQLPNIAAKIQSGQRLGD